IACEDLPFGFNPTDTADLVALFGLPQVVDNCAAEAIELDPIYTGSDCGLAGTIVRRFQAIDEIGNVSIFIFTQTITIIGDDTYSIGFPADTITDCVDDIGLTILGAECADLTVTFTDEIVEPQEGEEEACLVIARTYLVVDNCRSDSIFNPMQISRDEDCDGIEGEHDVWANVEPDSTYTDYDPDRLNAFPLAGIRGTDCDGETNPEGYLRDSLAADSWTYTQRIVLLDTVQPTLSILVPDSICVFDQETCLSETSIEVTIEDQCSGAGGEFIVLIDLDSDGEPDFNLNRDDHFTGEFPNFTITVDLPVGDHTYMIRYIDGCDNSVSASVPVSVYDCAVPEMTCYSGLIVNLEALSDPIDVDGDGDLDEAVAVVDAGVLASCELNDCSAPLTFSVNRIGDTPSIDQTSLFLTCDDRYSIDLEVYMWDQAFNPFAVQPDGSIGGPNWSMCTVQVFVQDPDELCENCLPNEGITIGGEISTTGGVTLENAEVILSGTEDREDLTSTSGSYRFNELSSGDYMVEPYKNDDVPNGLNTLDVLILKRHLLGMEVITDPYVLLAADINADGLITVADELLLRQVILAFIDEFPNNTSWRFIDASVDLHEMPGDVLAADLPASIVIEEISACDYGFDFDAIKVGDLNGTAVANTEFDLLQGEERSETDSYPVQLEDRWLEAGETYRLPIIIDEIAGLNGLQFTMALSNDVVLLSVDPALLEVGNIGTSRLDRNEVMVSWNQTNNRVEGEATLMYIELMVNRSVPTTDVFSLVDLPTAVEAYDTEDATMNLHLQYHDSTSPVAIGQELELLQNFPNPFVQSTNIRFYMPEAGEATIVVRNAVGERIRTISGNYAAGYHVVQIEGNDVPAGVYFYQLQALGETRNRSMMRLR
ncbi:MAG: T9SS type A sorting domain-containing protein, partial [Bacteroidota bacterium]